MVALIVVVAYLIGAIPSGLIVGRIGYGVDLRDQGSGNIGSTNAKRVLGDAAGYIVLALDVLKGLLVTLGAAWATVGSLNWPPSPSSSEAILIVAAAIAVIVGNVFPVYIGFRGGKGVGVGAGALLGIVPLIATTLAVIWLATRAITRYVSVASILIALLFPALMLWRHPDNLAYIVFSIFAAVLVVYTHRANVRRLVAGEEPRLGAEQREHSDPGDGSKENDRGE